jgi:hypothetical protein
MRRLNEYDDTWLSRQTLPGLLFKGTAALFVIGVVVTLVGSLAFGWFRAGANIIGPDNVRSQWQFAYDTEASLDQIAVQWCTAKKAEDAATGQSERMDRTSQRIAIEQNYARVAAMYNGRLNDAFRAKWVKPSDVPTQAPPLTQVVQRTGCLQ